MTCDTEPTKISAKRWKSDSDNALKMSKSTVSLGFESASIRITIPKLFGIAIFTAGLRFEIWDLRFCEADMQYKRFEDLPVWRDSIELARSMYEFTALDLFRRHPGLARPVGARRAFGF